MKLKTFQTTEIQIRSVCVSVHTRVIEFCLSSKKICQITDVSKLERDNHTIQMIYICRA